MDGVYFMCPGPVQSTIETMLTMGLRFNSIISCTTRRCLDIARDVSEAIPSRDAPFVSDLILPQGVGRIREPCSVLQADYPTIDFTGYFEESIWPQVAELDEHLIERVQMLVNTVNIMEGRALIVAPHAVIKTYSGVNLAPGGFFRLMPLSTSAHTSS